MNVLAISSSRVGNGGFLEDALSLIKEFIPGENLKLAFVPFASVQRSYDEYGNMVKEALAPLHCLITIVKPDSAKTTIDNSDVVLVGGGNTFKLLHDIYQLDLFELIQPKVKNGMPYIGWSAGANITGKSIGTTNDMPIIEPFSFTAFGFFPFQINPHYVNQRLDGHNGETRDQRLEEFVALNPTEQVIALPEGTALRLKNSKLDLIGNKEAVLFQANSNNLPVKTAIEKEENISWLYSNRSV